MIVQTATGKSPWGSVVAFPLGYDIRLCGPAPGLAKVTSELQVSPICEIGII